MEHVLRNLDPLTVAVIVIPLALIAASSALRVACAICEVRAPEFVPAAAVVIVVLAVNLLLRIGINHYDMTLGLFNQGLLALLTSALVVALSVRTSIASALAITVTQVFLCGLVYFGLQGVGHAML